MQDISSPEGSSSYPKKSPPSALSSHLLQSSCDLEKLKTEAGGGGMVGMPPTHPHHPLLYGHPAAAAADGYGKLGGDMYGEYSRLFAAGGGAAAAAGDYSKLLVGGGAGGGGGGDYSKLLGAAGLGGGYNPFMQAPYMNMNMAAQTNIPGIVPTSY